MRTYITNYKWRWILALMLTFGGLLLLSASPPSNVATAKSLRPNTPIAERTGTHTTNAPTAATFSAPLELVRPLSPLFFQQGGEPEIKVDNFGNIYVTAIQGVPGGVDLWKSITNGSSFVYLGEPDGAQDHCPTIPQCAGLGGGDDQIDVSPGGYLYVSSLWLGNVTMSTSYDGGTGGVLPGQKWEVHPAAAALTPDDRQWVAAYGPQTLNMTWATTSVTNPPGGIGLFFDKSTDGGKTFSVPVEITPTMPTNSVNVEGNLVVDPYNGNLYTSYIPNAALNQINLSSSTDAGATWRTTTAYTGPAGTDNRGVFPILALDRGGNLHLVFTRVTTATQAAHIFMTSTANPSAAAPTWLPAVQVDSGSGNTTTAVEPWVVAGSPGVVNITWLGTAAANHNVAADWFVFFAQTTNALSGSPVFNQTQATAARMHDHSICFNGSGCASNGTPGGEPENRDLAEYYTMTLGPDGMANIAYADSVTSCPAATCTSNAWFIKQTGGTSAYAPPTPPAPATFTPNIQLPASTNDAEPSIWADAFNCLYATSPGNPDVWKSVNNGGLFVKLPTPPVLPTGGGDEDIITLPSATRPAPAYLADLAVATVSIRKSTDGGQSFFSPGTGGAAGELNASSDRQWIIPDVNGANVTLYEMDHEFVSEAIRFAASVNDSPWAPITGITDPELQGSTIPNTNPGPIFVNHTSHTVYGVFTSSIPTTNANQPPFGKQPNVWVASGAGTTTAGIPPGPFTDHPVFKGVIDSPTNPAPPAGSATFGTSTANDFPGGDIDAGGNVYAVWAMNNARTNQYAVWLAASHDGGNNFYGPFQISAGTGSAEMPWIAGGDAGRVEIIFYYSSDAGDPNTANLHWNAMFAQSLNANSREPVFTVSQMSDHIMHFGPICNQGILCGSGTRTLLDFFEISIGPDGLANVVFADSGNANSPTQITYARQLTGPLAIVNPTFPTCLPGPPQPISVVSEKTHSSAGTFDVVLPLTPHGIECRVGQPGGTDHKVIFTFGVPVTLSSATVSSGTGSVSSTTVSGNVITVNLTGVTNAQTIMIKLTNVSDGTLAGDVTWPMDILLGDTTANKSVNSSDVSQTKLQSGTAASQDNFRTDVNLNGVVNSTDVSIVKIKSGTAIP